MVYFLIEFSDKFVLFIFVKDDENEILPKLFTHNWELDIYDFN